MPEPPYQQIPLMVDPPYHTKWRKLLGGWFSPGRYSGMMAATDQATKHFADLIAVSCNDPNSRGDDIVSAAID